MKIVVNKLYQKYYDSISRVPEDFNSIGSLIYDGRNQIRSFKQDDLDICIKSFKKPNIVNKIIYRYFRKSKAQRSYEYADKLASLGINTPRNIAYIERGGLLFSNSYYLCELFESDFCMLEVRKSQVDDLDNLLRQFTRFTCLLHANNVLHIDYSPGNILIKKNGNDYIFSLVDINRMKFQKVSIETGIRNFAKLWNSDIMLNVISDEYSKLHNLEYEYVYSTLFSADKEHKANVLKRREKKERIKKLLAKN